MAQKSVPHFQNDIGVASISVGTKEFMCMGASPPLDHPHVFIDMGDADEAVCPYCSTLFKLDPTLEHGAARPSSCAHAA